MTDLDRQGRETLVTFEAISGPEGVCLGVGTGHVVSTRVAGPKPWGGGSVIHRWEVELADLQGALPGAALAAREDTEREHVEALRRIANLMDRWDAPISHKIGDEGEAKWAAVGSEAHKIAVDTLKRGWPRGHGKYDREVQRDTEQEINEATGDPIDEGYAEHAWSEPDASDGLDDEREGRGR